MNGVFAGGAGGLLGDIGAAGTPSNLGKVGDASELDIAASLALQLMASIALADADPLGVNQNVTFDEVGGLDDRKSARVRMATAMFTLCSRHQLIEGDDPFAFAIP